MTGGFVFSHGRVESLTARALPQRLAEPGPAQSSQHDHPAPVRAHAQQGVWRCGWPRNQAAWREPDALGAVVVAQTVAAVQQHQVEGVGAHAAQSVDPKLAVGQPQVD